MFISYIRISILPIIPTTVIAMYEPTRFWYYHACAIGYGRTRKQRIINRAEDIEINVSGYHFEQAKNIILATRIKNQ